MRARGRGEKRREETRRDERQREKEREGGGIRRMHGQGRGGREERSIPRMTISYPGSRSRMSRSIHVLDVPLSARGLPSGMDRLGP